MRRNLFRQSLLWLVMSTCALPAAAAPAAAISFAEAPVRLVRDTNLYAAARGARLQNGDIVESGASPIQLEGLGGATVALGPASRLYLKLGGASVELTLLAGWLKITSGAGGPGGATAVINAGALRVNPEGSSLIVHAAPGKTALFIESGAAAVAEMQGAKAQRTTRLAREQYAVRTAREPLKVMPRAPKEFLGGMPPAFFDPLVAVSFKGAAPVPKLERGAVFAADVAPWLADDPAVFQVLNRRFNPPQKRAPASAQAKPAQPAQSHPPIY